MVPDDKARAASGPAWAPKWWMGESVAARILRPLVARIACGHITVILPSADRIAHTGPQAGPSATVVLHRWRAVRRLVTGGDLGFAEAYMDGDWSSPDLAALLELAARNLSAIDARISGLGWARLVNRAYHRLRANSRSGSRRNIAFHYDLGNPFYGQWLDPGMIYSAALYDHADQSLEDAQEAKLARIVELLRLKGGEDVLEIGCGWGALAMRVAQVGAKVTGLTLSTEQLSHARNVVADHRLSEWVRLELKDYRDAQGSYDRIMSIEMLEAVGEAYWPTYFQALHDRLKSGGHAVLQVITIDDARFESYRGTTDFIQRHVFPGGMLPTRALIASHGAAAGLTLVETQSFGQGYALTLAEWRRRFHAAWPTIAQMGFGERFRRLWDYYLCYCEAGFRAGTIDVGFFVLTRGAEAKG